MNYTLPPAHLYTCTSCHPYPFTFAHLATCTPAHLHIPPPAHMHFKAEEWKKSVFGGEEAMSAFLEVHSNDGEWTDSLGVMCQVQHVT